MPDRIPNQPKNLHGLGWGPRGQVPTDDLYSGQVSRGCVLGIVVSEADEASVHIGKQLRELADWRSQKDRDRSAAEGGGTYWSIDGARIRTIDRLHVECENAARMFDGVDLLVFVSRHSGETGRLLSAHFTGNLGPADVGGKAGQLAEAAPGAVSTALEVLDSEAPPAYDVSMECTHHGPSAVGVPSLFVELGSDERAWRDPEGARAVARATLLLRDVDPQPDRSVVCVGGGHYAPRATRIARETDWSVGHVASDWALSEIDGAVDFRIEQLLDRSGATRAVIDGDQPDIERIIDDLGYTVVSESWLQETTGVSVDRAEALEAELSTVTEGLRFGDDVTSAHEWTVQSLPAELLATCHAADRQQTVDIVAGASVAYETEENGNRLSGRIAVVSETARAALIDELADLLRGHHDEVHRDTDMITLVDRVFDPEAASTLGVPEGPAFGRLANGTPVTIDGETIEPSEVQSEEIRRLNL